MDIIKTANLPIMQTGWGVKGKQVVDLPDVGIINLILEPGEQVPAHKTPVDVLFQVIAGRGTVTIGEEQRIAETGDIIISPAMIPHSLVADQNSPFSFYVIKVPNTKKSAIKDQG
jgi:quercetin dioxygenase-like cupin family protein